MAAGMDHGMVKLTAKEIRVRDDLAARYTFSLAETASIRNDIHMFVRVVAARLSDSERRAWYASTAAWT